MGSKYFDAAKLKTGDIINRIKETKPSVTAIIILAVTVAALVLFNVVDRMGSNPGDISSEIIHKSKADASRAGISIQNNLQKISVAAGKQQFKAKIITDKGFAGYWTQNKGSYRLEDAAGQNMVIYNAPQKKLWMIDLRNKIVTETALDGATAEFYGSLRPAFFFGGLSASTGAGTVKIEDILPGEQQSQLTFTSSGLPQRWRGLRADGRLGFMAWHYMKLKDIKAEEFKPPRGFSVTSANPSQKTTTDRHQ